MLEKVVAELVSLHKLQNQEIKFTQVDNGKPGVIIPIPRAKKYDTYEKNEQKEK